MRWVQLFVLSLVKCDLELSVVSLGSFARDRFRANIELIDVATTLLIVEGERQTLPQVVRGGVLLKGHLRHDFGMLFRPSGVPLVFSLEHSDAKLQLSVLLLHFGQ